MAEFCAGVLTKAGLRLLAKAQAGAELKILRMAAGDGILASGQSLENLTGLINEKKEMTLQRVAAPEGETTFVTGSLTNQGLESGFFLREIGVFAHDPDEGEILYAVSNAGEKSSYLAATRTPTITEEIYSLQIIVTNAQTITAIINESLVFATLEDLGKKLSKDEYEQDKAERDARFHDHELVNRIRQNKELIKVGEVRYPSKISNHSSIILKCTSAGTTGTSEPDFNGKATGIDGSVTWQVLDVTNLGGGVPTGTIIAWGGLTPPAGYLECAGQTLKRATYKDLFAAIGTTWGTTASDNFKLPDFKSAARFLRSRGDGLEVGTVQGDAMRNIKGDIAILRSPAYIGGTNGVFKTSRTTSNTTHGGNPTLDQPTQISMDISLDVPTADENRPKSAVVMYCIKATDVYTNQEQIDLAKIDQEKANRDDVRELTGTRLWRSDVNGGFDLIPVKNAITQVVHGLNIDPLNCFFGVYLVCQEPEYGYQKGDVAGAISSDWAAQYTTNMIPFCTKELIGVPVGNYQSGIVMNRRDGTNYPCAPTFSKWRFVFWIRY